MEKDILRYTMRINKTLLNKLHYISEYEGRSVNKQLEQLVKRLIKEYENEHGIITEDLLKSMYSNRP